MSCVYSNIKLYHVSTNPNIDLVKGKLFCTYPKVVEMDRGIAGTLGIRVNSEYYIYEVTINPKQICFFNKDFYTTIFGTDKGFLEQLDNQTIEFDAKLKGFEQPLIKLMESQAKNESTFSILNSGVLQHYRIVPSYKAIGYYHKTFGGFEVCIFDTKDIKYKLKETKVFRG